MPLELDVYWSFRSPYSYLATPRLVQIEKEYDVRVNVKPVLPLALRKPEFFEQVNPLWPPYLLRDTFRISQHLGLDYSWPRPDPVVQEFPSRKIAAEQPYAPRLTRLGQLATERGRGLPFISEISTVIWNGKNANWHEGTVLAEAAARAGLDLGELDALAVSEQARLDARIAQNQADLEAAGHWGVPTMVFEGEPFFGQDRLDLVLWRMKQKGLAPRA